MAFDKPAIFFFTKEPDCSACTAISPTWEAIKADPEFAAYEYEKHDIVDEMDLAASYRIEAAPTFVLLGKGGTKQLVNPGAAELRNEMRTHLQQFITNNNANNANTSTNTNTSANGNSSGNKLTFMAMLGILFPFLLVGTILVILFKSKKIDYYDGKF